MVIKTVGTAPYPPSVTFLTRDDTATGGWFRPMMLGCDATGADIAGAYEPILLADYVNINIHQANDGDSIDVWFLVRG